MTVTTGAKITASDYNSIQALIAPILGQGSGQSGYGQNLASSQLNIPATSTKITVAQWLGLRTDILTAYNHQASSTSTLPTPSQTTRISASDYNQYLDKANYCVTHKSEFFSAFVTTIQALNIQQAGNTWGRNGTNETAYVDASFTMTTNEARYYFNSGSDIRYTASLSGSWSNTTKDYSWQSTLSQMGTIVIGANSTYTAPGATLAGIGSNIGYFQLTSSFQTIYTKNSTTYIPNNVTVRAKATVTGSNVTVVIQIQYVDQAGVASGSGNVDELVQGILTTTLNNRYASGANQVTVTPPAITGSYSINATIPT